MGLIRYPGSKEKMAKAIVASFPAEASMPLWMSINNWEYREPFFGAGAIGFLILEKLPPNCTAWLNDIDYGLVCLWNAIKSDLDEMIKLILSFKPSTEQFYKFKDLDGNRMGDPTIIGFRKLALHQMSYSGLGAMSGGPLGGQKQDNTLYRVDCRWSPELLVKKCVYYSNVLRRTNARISCGDFAELITDISRGAFLYLDPPYVEAGPSLYKYSFAPTDHERLSQLLKNTPHNWTLSYDENPLVRQLYSWANFEPINTRYFIGTGNSKKSRKHNEVLIQPANLPK